MTDKLNAAGLAELFGRAILLRILKPHGRLPKRSRKHFVPDQKHLCLPHPAGTKLIRKFIRRGTGENTYYRNLYAQMTGHQLP